MCSIISHFGDYANAAIADHLNRYYADLEKKRCPEYNSNISVQNCTDMNACIVWRRFAK